MIYEEDFHWIIHSPHNHISFIHIITALYLDVHTNTHTIFIHHDLNFKSKRYELCNSMQVKLIPWFLSHYTHKTENQLNEAGKRKRMGNNFTLLSNAKVCIVKVKNYGELIKYHLFLYKVQVRRCVWHLQERSFII